MRDLTLKECAVIYREKVCPVCSYPRFYFGPQARSNGVVMNQNLFCASCGAGFNINPPETLKLYGLDDVAGGQLIREPGNVAALERELRELNPEYLNARQLVAVH